jgi:hypothetical protein
VTKQNWRRRAWSAIALAGLLGFNCPKQQEIAQPVPLSRQLPAADIVVSQESTSRFQTIGSALDAAHDGQTVLVMPGVYAEQVRIAGRRKVSLVGADPATTVIDATGQYCGVQISTDSNRVSGFTVRDADSHGIWVRDGPQFFDHCLIVGNGDRGVYLSAMAGYALARIDHCTIVDNGEAGIHVARDDSATAVTNSIVAGNRRGIVADRGAGGVRVSTTCLHNAEADLDRVSAGQGILIQEPLFAAPDRGDYTLTRRSPCLGRASDGANLGVF